MTDDLFINSISLNLAAAEPVARAGRKRHADQSDDEKPDREQPGALRRRRRTKPGSDPATIRQGQEGESVELLPEIGQRAAEEFPGTNPLRDEDPEADDILQGQTNRPGENHPSRQLIADRTEGEICTDPVHRVDRLA